MKKSVNPFVFTVFILVSVFTCFNVLSINYLEYTYNSYDKRLSSNDEFIKLKDEILATKSAVSRYENILSVKESFAKMSNNSLSNAELIDCAITVVDEAERHNIEPELIVAIIATESSFRKDIVSNKGAVGLMQLLPPTAHYISKKHNHSDFINDVDLYDPVMNIKLGISYFAYLIEKTGSIDHAIIAYNYGPVNLKRAIEKNRQLPKNYRKSVLKNYNKIVAINK